MPGLTPIQRKVLEVFERRAAAGEPPPTYGELSFVFGWKSRNAAKQHVIALTRKGLLKANVEGVARGSYLGEQIAYRTQLIDRLDKPGGVDLLIPTYILPEEGVLFGFNQPDDRLALAGVLQADIILVGPKTTPVKPRLLVVSERGLPVAVKDSPAARRRAVGVVVASIRSQAAAALED